MAIIADFKGEDGLWAKSVGKHNYKTLSYAKWINMVNRCRDGSTAQIRRPTYNGCSLSDYFKDFQNFTDWHTLQAGYSLKYHMDKDILVQGNKQYNEVLCVLVPLPLNNFLTSAKAIRGELPIGVTMNGCSYASSLCIDGKGRYLGTFSTPEEAHLAYKAAKEAEAYRWYERLRDGEFIVDPRVIERMRTWTLPENL